MLTTINTTGLVGDVNALGAVANPNIKTSHRYDFYDAKNAKSDDGTQT